MKITMPPLPVVLRRVSETCWYAAIGANGVTLIEALVARHWQAAVWPLVMIAAGACVLRVDPAIRGYFETKRTYWLTKVATANAKKAMAELMLEPFRNATEFSIGVPMPGHDDPGGSRH